MSTLEIRAADFETYMPAAGETRTLTVLKSQNAKTGPVSATYRPQTTCPTTCPLWAASACYAMQRGAGGRPAAFSHAERGTTDYGDLVAMLTSRRAQDTIRFNVTGDYLRPDGSPDMAYIDATNDVVRIRAAEGRPTTVLAYSHAWRDLRPEWFAYVVRASCDTLAEVAQATTAGWSAVLVVPEDDPDGIIGSEVAIDGATRSVRMVPCVNQVKSAVQCDTCKLCARDTSGRSAVVFTAHGSGRRRVLPMVDA